MKKKTEKKDNLLHDDVIAKEAYQMLYDGATQKSVADFLRRSKRPDSLLAQINKIITEEFATQRLSLIGSHSKRYESIYTRNVNFNPNQRRYNRLPDFIKKQMHCDHLMIAMQALLAKEKLFGMHSKTYKVQVNNFYKEQEKRNKPKIGFKSLTLAELIELKEIVQSIKVQDNTMPRTDTFIRPSFEDEIYNLSKMNLQVNMEEAQYEILQSPLKQIEETNRLKEQYDEETKEAPKILEDLHEKIQETTKNELKHLDDDTLNKLLKLKEKKPNGKK